MAKFIKKRGGSKPEISTASLPDIIFMLLFFFMVVTVFQEQLKVNVTIPEATELDKLKHKSLIDNIYIGKAIDAAEDSAPVIQIEDAFVKLADLEYALKLLENQKQEKLRPLMTTNLKVDKDVRMGPVTDVKTEIRKANRLKVSYAAVRSAEK